MLNPRDEADGLDELPPSFALCLENLSAGRRQPVITASPLPGLLHPAATDPAAFFQAIEQRIKRGHIETQRSARTHFDELPELIAMPRSIFDKRKNEQLRAPLLQLPIKDW